MYVKDLTLAPGSKIVAEANLYYTGTLVSTDACVTDGSGQAISPILLYPTLYGDFDADGGGNDADDTAVFVDAWCSCGRTSHCTNNRYDAFLDRDCDGDIDNDDKAKYNANWGINFPKVVPALASLCSCDPAKVCDSEECDSCSGGKCDGGCP